MCSKSNYHLLKYKQKVYLEPWASNMYTRQSTGSSYPRPPVSSHQFWVSSISFVSLLKLSHHMLTYMNIYVCVCTHTHTCLQTHRQIVFSPRGASVTEDHNFKVLSCQHTEVSFIPFRKGVSRHHFLLKEIWYHACC